MPVGRKKCTIKSTGPKSRAKKSRAKSPCGIRLRDAHGRFSKSPSPYWPTCRSRSSSRSRSRSRSPVKSSTQARKARDPNNKSCIYIRYNNTQGGTDRYYSFKNPSNSAVERILQMFPCKYSKQAEIDARELTWPKAAKAAKAAKAISTKKPCGSYFAW